MARMKFLCDTERCIDCNGCATACKNEHQVPWGMQRRRVVTIGDGGPGERSVSVACMHCNDAPCMAVCPVDCFYHTRDGVVLHSKELCIGCGYCYYACPFGAPQFPTSGVFNARGKMDKCTFCAGGPAQDGSKAELEKYGQNRLAEGKLPACAEQCATKSLLAGDADVIASIYRERVALRGYGPKKWGWDIAYRGDAAPAHWGPMKSEGQPANAVQGDFQNRDHKPTGPSTGIEVPQWPKYENGQYRGKPDDLPESRFFQGDAERWAATQKQRTLSQDEYERTGRQPANR